MEQLPTPSPQAWSQDDLRQYLSQPLIGDKGRPVPGTEHMTIEQVEDDILKGGRFRVFLWTFSIVIMSFQRSSGLRYYRSGQGCGGAAWGYTLLSSVVGWWGIPWGIFFTIHAIYRNCLGGKDVTADVLGNVLGPARAQSILARAQKPGADIALWLLRILAMGAVLNIVVVIVMAVYTAKK
ncbi:MAG: hypothetical protein JNG86_21970 [Verrucomicrobiaceae bacterium]|nr:hypothetical protein [Verrucomicrobiaceae bacterium]